MHWTDLPSRPAPAPPTLAVRGQPTRSLADLLAAQARAARGPHGEPISAARLEGTLIEGNRVVSRGLVRLHQPGGLSLATSLPGGTHTLRWDEGGAWAQAPGQPQPVRLTGTAAQALWRAAQWPSLALTLADFQARGHNVALLGMADQAGAAHYVLQLRLSDGTTRDYALDARTHLLRRARDVANPNAVGAADRAPLVERRWEDFRAGAGRLVPFGEEERSLADPDRPGSGGRVLRTWQWRAVALNPPPPD